MFEEAISILSICSSMNSWLTPTVLFFLLNLMIGTIFFTSGFSSHKPSHHNNHLNNNNINNNINNHEFHHHQQQQQQQQQPTFHCQQQQQQPQLITRSSSILQRLKSINFNNLYSTLYTQPPTTHYQSPPPEPESRPEPEPETSPVGSEEDDGEGPTMEEIYSRIQQGNQVSHYGRQNSDTKPSGGEIPVKLPQKMKKSASVKSAFNHFHFNPPQNQNSNNSDNNGNGNPDVGVAGKKATPLKKAEKKRESVKNANASIKEEREDEGGVVVESASVDAKADDFINRFKKQLQLQRNDSILRYKDMISSRFSAK